MNAASDLSDCPSSDTTHQTWKTTESFARQTAGQSSEESPWIKTRLQIPRGDETLFAFPLLAHAPAMARQNSEVLSTANVNLQGRSIAELRQSARREVLDLARNYTSKLLGQPLSNPLPAGLLFCSGHQPALFHPGVWVKNFAIHALARRVGGVALNLVVDNDTLSNRQLRLPIGDREHPRASFLPFDDPQPNQPWEEAALENPTVFSGLGSKVEQVMQRWNIDPLISNLWADAVSQLQQSPSLRDAFTAARRKQEHRFGVENWELPLSQVCQTDSFLWFAAAVLKHLPRFWETYNSVLEEFRRVNRIRSHTHPVPALIESNGWYEAPFWVWSQGRHQRKRVMAKACSKEVRLSDGNTIFARLPISNPEDVSEATRILKGLSVQKIRLRTRALTTTLFARLCLSDLFVHGIGGAKYDEMTDRLITRFFGLPAPGFLTMSCTVHLPLGEPYPTSATEEQKIRHQIRDLQFNPERHLAKGVDANRDALMTEKQTLVRQKLSLGNQQHHSRENHQRHIRLRQITTELALHTGEARKLLDAELATVEHQLAANRVLADREFSFALYPEEKLHRFFTQLDAELL